MLETIQMFQFRLVHCSQNVQEKQILLMQTNNCSRFTFEQIVSKIKECKYNAKFILLDNTHNWKIRFAIVECTLI